MRIHGVKSGSRDFRPSGSFSGVTVLPAHWSAHLLLLDMLQVVLLERRVIGAEHLHALGVLSATENLIDPRDDQDFASATLATLGVRQVV